jgi:SAM-dependent methyltransferase
VATDDGAPGRRADTTDQSRGGDVYDDAVTARYLAHRLAGGTSPNEVMEGPAVLRHLGDLTGARVVDLGCGDARFAETVLERGARSYLGIDGSASMVAAARARPADRRVQIRRQDIEDVRLDTNSADLITSRLALHQVDDLGSVFRVAWQALSPSGRLLITVAHPIVSASTAAPVGPRQAAVVDDYFDPGPRRRSWFEHEVTWFHRTVEQYVVALLDAGFTLDALSECEPDPAKLAHQPDELARRRRAPLIVLLSAHRT